MELMRPLTAMLLGDEGGVISSDRLEPGQEIEPGQSVGINPATGQELVEFYLVSEQGTRLQYRALAADFEAATATRTA
jgi:hypothetical protein